MQVNDSRKITAYLLGIFAVVTWGATPVVTRVAIAHLDATAVAMLRTILAAAIILPFALLLRFRLPNDRGGWIALAVSGLSVYAVYTLLFTIGVKQTSTTHAAVILAAAPLFTGFIGFTVDRRWPRGIWWIGAMVALAGVTLLVLVRDRSANRNPATLGGDVMVFLSVIAVSAGYVAGGRLSAMLGSWAGTAWSICLAGIMLMPAFLLMCDLRALAVSSENTGSWLALAFLAVMTSIVGYAAWCKAIDIGSVGRVAPLQFFQPVVGLALAVIMLGEPLTAPIAIALAAIIGGVLLTRLGKAT